ncbi:hypothetical protein EMIT074MI3_10716 [Bacillus licheniformis]
MFCHRIFQHACPPKGLWTNIAVADENFRGRAHIQNERLIKLTK